MSTVVIATFESAHFSFTAVGMTIPDARKAMREGLKKHVAQYSGASRDFVREALQDTSYSVVPIGGCMRDGSVL